MEKRGSCSMDVQKAEREDACNIEGKRNFDTKVAGKCEKFESSAVHDQDTDVGDGTDRLAAGTGRRISRCVHIHLQRRRLCKCADRKHRAVQPSSLPDGVGACADISHSDRCLCSGDNG